MSEAQHFDLLILGGGMSYVGAIRAAQLGLKVGLVERDRLGGTCLNRGCIPTKAMLETADLLHRVSVQGAEFGLAGSDGVTLDYPALARRRDAVVEKHVKGVEFLMKTNGVTVLRGNGTLTGPTSVHVSGGEAGEVDATGTDLLLATGSAPRSLPGLEIDGERIITSDEALTRDAVPGRVAIVGAGAIGPDIGYYLKSALPDLALTLVDIAQPALDAALARFSGYAQKALARGKMTAAEAAAVTRDVRGSVDYDSLAGCDWVLEAATESLALKRRIFAAIEARVAPETIVTSNTSSLPAARIFAEMRHPARATVTHFGFASRGSKDPGRPRRHRRAAALEHRGSHHQAQRDRIGPAGIGCAAAQS
ncbi:MAG: 3-hydroxyacyl-CoA dehydrogenase NAD-binding domain-containing protein, partial [Candidatus Limnocylindria bacterium]